MNAFPRNHIFDRDRTRFEYLEGASSDFVSGGASRTRILYEDQIKIDVSVIGLNDAQLAEILAFLRDNKGERILFDFLESTYVGKMLSRYTQYREELDHRIDLTFIGKVSESYLIEWIFTNYEFNRTGVWLDDVPWGADSQYAWFDSGIWNDNSDWDEGA